MKRLQVIGPRPLPMAERPRCMTCVKPLRPDYQSIEGRATHPDSGDSWTFTVARYFTGQYGLKNSFCGPKHAEFFALGLQDVRRRHREYPRLSKPPIPPSALRQAARQYEQKWNRAGVHVAPLEGVRRG